MGVIFYVRRFNSIKFYLVINMSTPPPVVNFNNYWTDVADDAAVDTAVRSVLKYAIDTAKERGLYVPWTYLNYALPDQPIFESYGAVNLAKLKSIQRKYDPKNVLGRLWKGGFKL